ncbi:MAG: NADP-specific glutamate dehydrogenase [Sphaerochaetaceae bacterium]|jgi:glutamate dehydrogenase (NADP+)|nr:NADP-specific glutamate dehydrogenase [Sphaerochaetaceae bacterium]MDD3941053.1 NADP-specific glutamate dehydrogenase [Sphaerochaetaceae bacterium]MDX9938971.1 NADP-specific glutamate dehydrogenase [Sphaerochaetaceae bacterium]
MREITSSILQKVRREDPGQAEFHQAVHEFLISVDKIIDDLPHIVYHKVLERLIEPERTVIFRIPWVDDDGILQLNRGYRVQMNSALGPYKGGLRLHPSVDLSIMKFLAFEQTFKNSLTGLQLGGGKGGSNFDPKGKSDGEIMRFCQSFMTELSRHIGADTDIPAGDIGVGSREIGYLFGQYKRLRNEFTGTLTGKSPLWGGSYIRPEATGYGLVYLAAAMLHDADDTLEGKTCLVSGSGNVAQYTVEKLIDMGAKVVTLSDSSGCIHDPDGIDREKLAYVKQLKNVSRGRIAAYTQKYRHATYHVASTAQGFNTLWSFPADCAFPCATQNEISDQDARNLTANKIKLVAEGANMPTTIDGIRILQESGVLFAPAKAANAGGVAVSGLEMAQNSSRLQWTAEKVDQNLQRIMKQIHGTISTYAERYGSKGNLVDGANIAGFLKVANAMIDQGYV